MTLNILLFENKKTLFKFEVLSSLLPICCLVSLTTGQKGYFWCQRKVSECIGVPKSNVFKDFVMTLLASTRVFHRKVI